MLSFFCIKKEFDRVILGMLLSYHIKKYVLNVIFVKKRVIDLKRKKFSYTTHNRLATFLAHMKYDQELKTGKRVNIGDLEEKLATYCELTDKSIGDIKRGVNQPSLPVAMRIAAYFSVTVEDIFTLKTREEIMMEKAKELIEAAKELDSAVFARFNGAFIDFLDEAEAAGVTEENDSTNSFSNLKDFYKHMFVEGFSDEIKGQILEVAAQVEEKEKEKLNK